MFMNQSYPFFGGIFLPDLGGTLLLPYADNIFGEKLLADFGGTPTPFSDEMGVKQYLKGSLRPMCLLCTSYQLFLTAPQISPLSSIWMFAQLAEHLPKQK